MEITKFGLSNFRVFKEHFDFDLAPIMVLTGPNNSGKSSVSKALLLLKENEELINAENHYGYRLNYFKGEHDLGNHKFVVNNQEENTTFSFTFFLEYKFCVEINKKVEMIYDYKITTRNDELVIAQRDGVIKINVPEIILYFKEIISFYKTSQSLNQKWEFDNVDLDTFFKKIEELIYHLEDIGSIINSIDINLWDAYLCNEELFAIKQSQAEENLAKGIFSPILNLESDIVKIDEDTLDTDRQTSLIYLFHVITNIELTAPDLDILIPTSKLNFFSFPELVYIHTIKEPLKRAYSANDNLVFQDIIRNKIMKSRNEDFQIDYDMIINAGKQKDKLHSFFYGGYENFIKKWLKEFEIGEELSYGYDDDNDIYFIKIDNKSLLEYGLGYGLIIHILLALSREVDPFGSKRLERNLNFPVTYIIEEPETGLHPAFQSKMAEMIVDMQKIFDINLIIETHSEYFIRKLQFLTATKEIDSGDVAIYYFNSPNKVPINEDQIKKITIDQNGSLSDTFGNGFIDEGTNIKFELLRFINSQQN